MLRLTSVVWWQRWRGTQRAIGLRSRTAATRRVRRRDAKRLSALTCGLSLQVITYVSRTTQIRRANDPMLTIKERAEMTHYAALAGPGRQPYQKRDA